MQKACMAGWLKYYRWIKFKPGWLKYWRQRGITNPAASCSKINSMEHFCFFPYDVFYIQFCSLIHKTKVCLRLLSNMRGEAGVWCCFSSNQDVKLTDLSKTCHSHYSNSQCSAVQVEFNRCGYDGLCKYQKKTIDNIVKCRITTTTTSTTQLVSFLNF